MQVADVHRDVSGECIGTAELRFGSAFEAEMATAMSGTLQPSVFCLSPSGCCSSAKLPAAAVGVSADNAATPQRTPWQACCPCPGDSSGAWFSTGHCCSMVTDPRKAALLPQGHGPGASMGINKQLLS